MASKDKDTKKAAAKSPEAKAPTAAEKKAALDAVASAVVSAAEPAPPQRDPEAPDPERPSHVDAPDETTPQGRPTTEKQARKGGVVVRAKRAGTYPADVYRRAGDVFRLAAGDKPGNWMEELDEDVVVPVTGEEQAESLGLPGPYDPNQLPPYGTPPASPQGKRSPSTLETDGLGPGPSSQSVI